VLKRYRKNRLALLTWGSLAAIGLACFAIVGDQGLLKLHSMKQMERRLEAQLTELGLENDRLAHEIEGLNEKTRLEQVIRQELGFLQPDELIFYFSDERH